MPPAVRLGRPRISARCSTASRKSVRRCPGSRGESVQGSVEFVFEDQQGRHGYGGQGVGSNEGEQRPARKRQTFMS